MERHLKCIGGRSFVVSARTQTFVQTSEGESPEIGALSKLSTTCSRTQLVHLRHRSVNNFIMNMVATLAAYCFFDSKPQALDWYYIEDTKQLMLF